VTRLWLLLVIAFAFYTVAFIVTWDTGVFISGVIVGCIALCAVLLRFRVRKP
jgi:hypothetical protein